MALQLDLQLELVWNCISWSLESGRGKVPAREENRKEGWLILQPPGVCEGDLKGGGNSILAPQ